MYVKLERDGVGGSLQELIAEMATNKNKIQIAISI
jgi:hypothetical protein